MYSGRNGTVFERRDRIRVSLLFEWKDNESEKAGVEDCKKSYTKEKT